MGRMTINHSSHVIWPHRYPLIWQSHDLYYLYYTLPIIIIIITIIIVVITIIIIAVTILVIIIIIILLSLTTIILMICFYYFTILQYMYVCVCVCLVAVLSSVTDITLTFPGRLRSFWRLRHWGKIKRWWWVMCVMYKKTIDMSVLWLLMVNMYKYWRVFSDFFYMGCDDEKNKRKIWVGTRWS